LREIQAACGISSVSVVAYHLQRLEQKGYVNMPRQADGSRHARVIDILDRPPETTVLAFTGQDAVAVRKRFGGDPAAGVLAEARRRVSRSGGGNRVATEQL